MSPSIPIINHIAGTIETENFEDIGKHIEVFADTIMKKLELKIVKKVYYPFEPIGKTLVYILTESHFALHTWPEYNLIHFDLVSCKLLAKEQVKQAIMTSLDVDMPVTIKIEEYKI